MISIRHSFCDADEIMIIDNDNAAGGKFLGVIFWNDDNAGGQR